MIWPWWRRLPLGDLGERLAAQYLRRRGYRILHRNLELGRYEIDLVVQRNDDVAFVEVKTRRTDEFADPEVNVTSKKEDHIRKAANLYIDRYDDGQTYYRFDIISVVVPEKGRVRIEHFENAFQ